MVMWLYRLFFPCQHDWEVKDKTVLESPFEQINKTGRSLSKFGDPSTTFRKKIIIIMACKHCGDLRKFVDENP